MEKIFVADSYKDMEIVGEPFENDKGRLYVKVKGPCPRCGGSGHYSYNQMDGTRCYGCMGSGISIQKVRAYTEKEYLRMQASNERARAKREAEKEAKRLDLIENADKYKKEIAQKFGFSEDGKAYLVYGDDTYAIKDELKRLGARFDPTLKWYFSKEVALPSGYKLYEVDFDELYDYTPETKWASFKENAKEIVSKKMAIAKGPSTSVYYPGKEKDRIRNLTAKVASIRGFDSYYGYTSVFTFTSEQYVFVWMTTKCDTGLSVGDTVDLTGTIKKFDEYLGVHQTHLTRCIVKKVNA